jgi:hypothetical protein
MSKGILARIRDMIETIDQLEHATAGSALRAFLEAMRAEIENTP